MMPDERNASTTFRTILVAADFSDGSIAASHMVRSLVRPGATRVTVLHVVEPASQAERPLSATGAPERACLKEKLREVYAIEPAIAVEHVIKDGSAREEILRTAGDLGCDLIVMGTHGRTGLRRLLVGSVAEAVLRGAQCPVLALCAPALPRKAGPGRVLLHPTDFSERSEPALQLACTLAREHNARLVIVHVAPDEDIARGMIQVSESHLVYPDDLKEMRDRLEERGFTAAVETRVQAGDPASEILHAADETQCDLIVMGSHGRTGLGRLLMGSVAEAVLRSTRCPVLIVRVPLPEVSETAEAPQETATT